MHVHCHLNLFWAVLSFFLFQNTCEHGATTLLSNETFFEEYISVPTNLDTSKLIHGSSHNLRLEVLASDKSTVWDHLHSAYIGMIREPNY